MQLEKPEKNHREKGVLKKEAISDQVYCQYREYRKIRTNEGLVATGRFYPCTRIKNSFFYGISAGERFLPGIVWARRFIPGIVSRRGFIPGIFTDSGFQPGVINCGVFMPGIINGSNLIPGVIREKNFIPGSYTTDRKFAPGRFWNGSFESGVIEDKTFQHTIVDKLSADVVRALPREGYGMQSLRRYAPVGGIPIQGTVIGIMDDRLWYLPDGLVTDKGAVLGGFPLDKDSLINTHLISVDFEAMLEKMGLKKDGPLGSVGDKGAELLEDVNEWMESMMGGGPGNPFGSGKGADPGGALGQALEELGQGSSELIDALNKRNQDYWNDVIGRNTNGWISGSCGENGGQGNGLDHALSTVGGTIGIGTAIGGGIGLGIGSKGGLVGAATGAGIGAAVGAVGGPILGIGILIGEAVAEEDKPKESKPGSKAPGDEGEDPNSPDIGGAEGPPLYPEIPGERKFFKFVNTEEGKVLVVDRDALKRELLRTSKGTNIGLNILTGETIWVHLEPPSAEEMQQHLLHEMFKKMVTDPIYHPN